MTRDATVFALREAVAGLDLTEAEQRWAWLRRCETATAANIAAVIRKAPGGWPGGVTPTPKRANSTVRPPSIA